MPSRHGRTPLFTGDFWNVRHICITADSDGQVSVVARVDPAGIGLFVRSGFLDASKPHHGPGSVPQVRGEPDTQAPPGVCRVPRWPCSSPEEAGHGLSGLSLEPRQWGSELVEVVDGAAALAPAAAANSLVLMMPCGHRAPECLASTSLPAPAAGHGPVPGLL